MSISLISFFSAVLPDRRGYMYLFSGRRVLGVLELFDVEPGLFHWPWELPKALTWIDTQRNSVDRELYFIPHLLWGRTKHKTSALWTQCAYADDIEIDLLTSLPPSIVIESSPNRFQGIWRLEEIVNPIEVEGVNKFIVGLSQADTSGWDACQLLRIPFTTNHKYATKPTVKIVHFGAERYKFDSLQSLVPDGSQVEPELIAPETCTSEAVERPGPSFTHLSPTQRAIWEGKLPVYKLDGDVDRSETLMKIAGVLATAGATPEGIIGGLAERDRSLGFRKYSDRDDPLKWYRRIAEIVLRNRDRRPSAPCS